MTDQSRVVPTASRPGVQNYGIPVSPEGLLPWSFAESRLVVAKNYWVATVSPAGIPNVVPVWAAWIANRLYFWAGEVTRTARNLARNPHVSVNLESGDEVVYFKGTVSLVSDPPDWLSAAIDRAFIEKYNHHFSAEGTGAVGTGMFVVEPRVVLGWSDLHHDATRWTF